MIGDADIEAGLPLLFAEVRPRLDGVPYIIKTARSKYTKTSGFEVEVSVRLYDGKSATEGEAGGEGRPAARLHTLIRAARSRRIARRARPPPPRLLHSSHLAGSGEQTKTRLEPITAEARFSFRPKTVIR